MEGFVKVATVNEISPGEMKQVEVGDEQILVANIGGTLYAVSDVCTHAEGSLSEGYLEGNEVECPLHGSRFNVTTGEVVESPAQEPIAIYKVKVEGDDVLVGPA